MKGNAVSPRYVPLLPSLTAQAGGSRKNRAIVGLAIVVAGSAESERAGENQKSQEKMATSGDSGRSAENKTAKGKVAPEALIELPFEGPPGSVNAERADNDDERQVLNPPCVAPLRTAEPTQTL